MARETYEEGRLLSDRYRLQRKLGEGGMGQIWVAEHLGLKAPVAIKLIDRDVVSDDETLQRFMREAQAAATLRSPHVVQILDYGTDNSVPFMVMELLEGETLAERLRRTRKLSAADTARIIAHVARAVGRAHEAGIVHRDLKPENVFLVHNDDEEIAKVLDFGVAKVQTTSMGPEGTRTRTGSLLGTPYYMSPEQAQGNKLVDSRSDLWALAVMAFECLTGKRPFYSDGLGDLVLQICVRKIPVPSQYGAVPLGFDEWFKRGTTRDPEQRFQSAKELSDSLRDALGLEARETYTALGPDVLISSVSDSDAPPSAKQAMMPTARVSAFDRPTLDQALPSATTLREEEPAATEGDQTAVEAAVAAAEEASARSESSSLAPGWVETPEQHQLEERQPALTVQQFGTSHPSRPASPRRSGALLFVAAGALLAGAVLGVVLVTQGGAARQADAQTRPLPKPREVSASPRHEAQLDLASDKALPTPGDSATAPSSSAAENSEDEASDEALDAGTDADAKTETASDAGTDAWVKPAWAIPDDEPMRPVEPPRGGDGARPEINRQSEPSAPSDGRSSKPGPASSAARPRSDNPY